MIIWHREPDGSIRYGRLADRALVLAGLIEVGYLIQHNQQVTP